MIYQRKYPCNHTGPGHEARNDEQVAEATGLEE